jgi:membrane-associated phospholipid phosphatase
VHSFLFLNDLAHKSPILDEILRYFFVTGVPLLATILLAQLTIFWPSNSSRSRSKIVWAILVAVGFGALLMVGIEAISSALNLGSISTRPYMTRRVNLLVLEPQDNSFPSPELILAAIFCFASWTLSKKWGAFTSVLVILLGLTRMICGTNYLADVAFGAIFGLAFAALSFAIFKVSEVSKIRARQSGFSIATLGATLAGIYLIASSEPRFSSKLAAPWNSPALATSGKAQESGLGDTAPMSDQDAQNEAKTLALSKRASLYLPEVEAYLRGKLSPLSKPFSLLDIEVAPVKTADSTYRVASVRYEVRQDIPELRRQTVECGARLVKEIFALDSQIENVDVVAIMRGDATIIDNSQMRFTGDEVPVFTASVQRKNLIIEGNSWANSPTIDGGSWLRFRSRIYLNDRVLPENPHTRNEPKAPVLAGGKL